MIKMQAGRLYRLGIGAIIRCTRVMGPEDVSTELVCTPEPDAALAGHMWSHLGELISTRSAIDEWCDGGFRAHFYRYHYDGFVDVHRAGHPLNVVMEIEP